MSQIDEKSKSNFRGQRSQRGQVLIIVVFAITALVAFVGLVVDLGLVFIQYGRLRRSVDAAAIAASLQYREGYTDSELSQAAKEFLQLNGINDPSVLVETCRSNISLCDTNHDGVVSPTEERKFVHVVASSNVQLAFLPVIGIRSVPLQAEAVSEAASVDLVLLLDRSESMTDGSADPNEQDPSQCNSENPGGNIPGNCSPFSDVKKAAVDFVENYAYFPYDRVGMVSFDKNVYTGDDEVGRGLHLSNDETQIVNRIKNLWVYQAGADSLPGVDVGVNNPGSVTCANVTGYLPDTSQGQTGLYHWTTSNPPGPGPCREYTFSDSGSIASGTYSYTYGLPYSGHFFCPLGLVLGDYSTCNSTNTGGGLLEAGNELALNGRKQSLWVVILLSDGAANSSEDYINHIAGNVYCPDHINCRGDNIPSTRHCADPTEAARCEMEGGVWNPSLYDADDVARDMADRLAYDDGALIFTIGLGPLVESPQGQPESMWSGEQLLEYIADVGDGDLNGDGNYVDGQHAFYTYAPSATQLHDIFAKIASKIAVRLTQ